jgi:RimJ/RimL family protein N-acetyltransferase
MTDHLDSKRLILRTWEEGDREPYFRLASDPVVMQYLGSPATREEADAWINRHRAQLTELGFAYWAVELRETRQLIGAVGLSRVRYEAHFTPAVGVGWRLAQEFWGHGYASEAAEAVLRYGFEKLQLEHIVAVTVPANIRSQQVMQRLGMNRSIEDEFDHPRLPEGHPLRRCVLCRMSRQDWLAQHHDDTGAARL